MPKRKDNVQTLMKKATVCEVAIRNYLGEIKELKASIEKAKERATVCYKAFEKCCDLDNRRYTLRLLAQYKRLQEKVWSFKRRELMALAKIRDCREKLAEINSELLEYDRSNLGKKIDEDDNMIVFYQVICSSEVLKQSYDPEIEVMFYDRFVSAPRNSLIPVTAAIRRKDNNVTTKANRSVLGFLVRRVISKSAYWHDFANDMFPYNKALLLEV